MIKSMEWEYFIGKNYIFYQARPNGSKYLGEWLDGK